MSGIQLNSDSACQEKSTDSAKPFPIRDSLFIFGSFSEGMFHYKKIAPHIKAQIPVQVIGSLYRLSSGIPALVNEGTQAISGWVVTLKDSEILLTLLDQFHGFNRIEPEKSLFVRDSVQVYPEDRSRLAEIDSDLSLAANPADESGAIWVNAYVLHPNRLSHGAKVIEDADWQRSLRQDPPLFERLTDRQAHYIKQLGNCSGRDVVRIDLDLCRELIRLGLAVDKGRRLGLTSLGQEIHRLLL